ncbi:MAG: hypothetical protein OXG11_13005 [Chloroflexi bacterium]|nr:hypothetical protein [Chloroflexota bacterium]
MTGLEFGLVHGIIAVVALLLIALGITYRRATEAAANITFSRDGRRLPGLSRSSASKVDHSQFMPQQAGESLGIRPNPAHLRILGLVTWEADRVDRVEAAHSRIRVGLENQLAAMDSSSSEAAEVRARLRRAAEARHVLLQRLSGKSLTD